MKLRKGLVIAQVALSFLLLAGAGLFVKTLSNLKHMNSGFQQAENLVTFQVDPALNGYSLQRLQAFYKRTLESIRSVPGVKSAGYSVVPVLAGGEWDSSMAVEGHKFADGEDMQAFMNAISPGYFQTMGVPLPGGPRFRSARIEEGGTKTTAAIVNRKFATHFFGDKSPDRPARRFRRGPKSKLDIEIVGVTEDTLYEGPPRRHASPGLRGDGPIGFPRLASPFMFAPPRIPRRCSRRYGKKVREQDSSMPIYEMKTLENQLDETLTTERLIATLSGAFGVLATVLAAIGLYGVLAFVVARRTKEIGLRMALGAPQGSVVWMVRKEALILLAIGLAVGVPGALLLSHYVSSQLFGVKAKRCEHHACGARGPGRCGDWCRFSSRAPRQHDRPASGAPGYE